MKNGNARRSTRQATATFIGTIVLAAGLLAPAPSFAGAEVLPMDVASSTSDTSSSQAPIFIDNDELSQQQITYEETAPETDTSGHRLKVGARFPVVLQSGITSRTAKVGDLIEARLKYDLKIKDRLVAPKGSLVRGHIDYAQSARTPLRCTMSRHRWTVTSGCIGMKFDEIVNGDSHIPLVGEPARTASYVKNKAEGRDLGINHKGQIAGPYSMQIRYMAVRMGLNAAMTPAGVFSFGAMPVALGILGAANPSFAFGKPVGDNVRHRRIKGFFWGALSGVPGSWLIEGTTVKGEEVVINPGDEFLCEVRQEFDGAPTTETPGAASSNAQASVHGEVITKTKKAKSQHKH